MIIRCASGFGDAFYLYPICNFFRKLGHEVKAVTNHKQVMGRIECVPYDRRIKVDIDCHYVQHKERQGTTVWDDSCEKAGIITTFEHYLSCSPCNNKIAVVIEPYAPSWANPNGGFVPKLETFQRIIDDLTEKGYRVNLMSGERSVEDWFAIYAGADFVVSQSSSHFVMAEAWNKKCYLILSEASRTSENWYIRTITPDKIIIKPYNTIAIYDDQYEKGMI